MGSAPAKVENLVIWKTRRPAPRLDFGKARYPLKVILFILNSCNTDPLSTGFPTVENPHKEYYHDLLCSLCEIRKIAEDQTISARFMVELYISSFNKYPEVRRKVRSPSPTHAPGIA